MESGFIQYSRAIHRHRSYRCNLWNPEYILEFPSFRVVGGEKTVHIEDGRYSRRQITCTKAQAPNREVQFLNSRFQLSQDRLRLFFPVEHLSPGSFFLRNFSAPCTQLQAFRGSLTAPCLLATQPWICVGWAWEEGEIQGTNRPTARWPKCTDDSGD